MWTLFSRDSSKDFPFEIVEWPDYKFNEKSLWRLTKGKKKNSVQEVSVFELLSNEDSSREQTRLTLAKSAVKHLKTLKHPSVLNFLESTEVKTSINLATEYVEPLQSFLTSQNDLHGSIFKQYIAWGISNIIEGLKFINFEAKLCHNKVCIWSVFVNKAGQWKLGELEYMKSIEDSPPINIDELYCSPVGHRNLPFSIDVWGLGVLIWEIFNGPLNHKSALKDVKKIPSEILKIYPKMIAVDPFNRPSYDTIISTLREQRYFGNNFEKTMTALSQHHLLDDSQRTTFLETLSNSLETFPKNIAQYYVLPSLLEMFNYVKEQKVIFPSMIKLSTMLDDHEFEEKIVPCIVKLFECNDRLTRLMLLNHIEFYADRLKPDLLNTNIFPLLISGLADASPTIRELTVRSMVYISSKLNYNNLNVDLMRHFARLQMKDDQGGIRTNTTVCLAKIAQYIDPKIRSKILASAFSRALKDPFHPSRMAGVSAFSATQQYYPLFEVSTRVLPALCLVTLDPEKTVRDLTFRTIKSFLGKLENVSEDPTLKEKMEEEVINTASPAIPTWAGWAVTTVTSKFYSTKNPQKDEKSFELSKNDANNTNNVNNGQMLNNLPKTSNDIVKNMYMEKQEDHMNILQDNRNYENSTEESNLSNDWNDNSGWNVGDDWESIGDKSTNSDKDKAGFGWEDQDSIILDDPDIIAKKLEADTIKEEMRRKREERKQERIKQIELKRNSKQTLKLGGKRL